MKWRKSYPGGVNVTLLALGVKSVKQNKLSQEGNNIEGLILMFMFLNFLQFCIGVCRGM